VIISTYYKSLYSLPSLCWERGLYRIANLCPSGIRALRHASRKSVDLKFVSKTDSDFPTNTIFQWNQIRWQLLFTGTQ